MTQIDLLNANLKRLFLTALQHHQNQEIDKAKIIYEEILGYHPFHPSALSNVGIIYFFQQRYDDAINCFHKLAALRPTDGDAFIKLATALMVKGYCEAAIQCYVEASKHSEYAGIAYRGIAEYHCVGNRYAKAIEFYEMAIEGDCKDYEIYIGLACSYQALGRLDEARSAYNKAVDCGNPVDCLLKLSTLMKASVSPSVVPEACSNIELRMRAGDLSIAQEQLCELSEIQNDHPEVLLLTGMLHSSLGNRAEAAKFYRKAVYLGRGEERYYQAWKEFSEGESAGTDQTGGECDRPVSNTSFVSFFQKAGFGQVLTRFNPVPERQIDFAKIASLGDDQRLSVYHEECMRQKGMYVAKGAPIDILYLPGFHSVIISQDSYVLEKTFEVPPTTAPYALPLRMEVRGAWPFMDFSPYMGKLFSTYTAPQKRVVIDEPAIYIGGSVNFGHFLLDFLPKLLGPIHDGSTKDRKIYTYSLDVPQREAVHWLFPDCAFADISELSDEPSLISFTSAIVPSYVPGATRFEFLNKRFDTAIAGYSHLPMPHEKIYVTRGERSRVVNEADVVDFLRGEGFAIVDPFNTPFMETAYLFRNASVIISAVGSQTTSLAFCRPGTTYVELRPYSYHISPVCKWNNSLFYYTGVDSHLVIGLDDKVFGTHDGHSFDVASVISIDKLVGMSHLWRDRLG